MRSARRMGPAARSGASRPAIRPLLAILAAAMAVALVPGAPAVADHGQFDRRVRSELRAVLDGYRSSRPVPGLSASILMPDGTRWSGVSGVAKVGKNSRSMTRGTTFVAASITKTFVAA